MKSLEYRSLLLLAAMLIVFCTALRGQACPTALMSVVGIGHRAEPDGPHQFRPMAIVGGREVDLPNDQYPYYLFRWVFYVGSDTIDYSLLPNPEMFFDNHETVNARLYVTGIKQGDEDFRTPDVSEDLKELLPKCWVLRSFGRLGILNTNHWTGWKYDLGWDADWSAGPTMGMSYPFIIHIPRCAVATSVNVKIMVTAKDDLFDVTVRVLPSSTGLIRSGEGSLDFNIETQADKNTSIFVYIDIPPGIEDRRFDNYFDLSVDITDTSGSPCFPRSSKTIRHDMGPIDPTIKTIINRKKTYCPEEKIRFEISAENIGGGQASVIEFFDPFDERLDLSELTEASFCIFKNGSSFGIEGTSLLGPDCPLSEGRFVKMLEFETEYLEPTIGKSGLYCKFELPSNERLNPGEKFSIRFDVKLKALADISAAKARQLPDSILNYAYSRFETGPVNEGIWCEGKTDEWIVISTCETPPSRAVWYAVAAVAAVLSATGAYFVWSRRRKRLIP